MTYVAPGVQVTVVENRRIINLAEDVRVPAIVGVGPTILTATNEAVERGASGSVDPLAHTPIDAMASGSVLLTNLPNNLATSGSLNFEDNLYAIWEDFSIDASGNILWKDTAGCVANASLDEGEVYYANYTYVVDESQYNPATFVDSNDIIDTYGSEDPTDGCLTIAGRMALENGAPAAILVQISGSATTANYLEAINKLQKQRTVSYVMAVFPSGSMSLSDMRTVQSYLKTHSDQMSQETVGLERGVIIGDASDHYALSGGVSMGSGEVDDHISRVQAIASKEVIYAAPCYGTRKDDSGATMTLDANYAACALAGLIAGQMNVQTPVTGKQLVGYTVINNYWTDFEMNRLGSAGVTVLYGHQDVVKVRDALTTDVGSAETAEPSVVDIERRVKRALRDGLNSRFMGKGVIVNEDTEDDVASAAISILSHLTRDGVIASYGTKNDPDTGEVPVSAQQDTSEPRRINVTASYKPSYPLNYIKVTVNTYV